MDAFAEAPEYAGTSDDESFASAAASDSEDHAESTQATAAAAAAADLLSQVHMPPTPAQGNLSTPPAPVASACEESRAPLSAGQHISAEASTDASQGSSPRSVQEAPHEPQENEFDNDSLSAASEPAAEPALTPEQHQVLATTIQTFRT